MPAKHYKYKYTLFTPCYNSANFIDRIRQTIDSQIFRDFEWIVINDASTDNTSELLNEYIKTISDIPVKFFDLKKNQMLAANWNLAVDNAEGEFFLVLGHDDIYVPNILVLYEQLLSKYDSDEIGGIIARCQTQYGKITPAVFSKPIMSYWEYGVDKNGNYTGEAPCLWKTDILKRYMPFDPKELINPLIGALMSCDGYKFIMTNEIVRKYYVLEAGGSSLTKFCNKYSLWQYRGALRNINLFSKHFHMSFSVKMKTCIGYASASIRLKLGFLESIKALQRYRWIVVFVYPYAWLKVLLANNEAIYRFYKKIKTARDKNAQILNRNK